MTQIMANDNEGYSLFTGLTFEIISARIADETEEKKYVVYTLQVRYISGNDDLSPSVIERRYTHFLNLYNTLRRDYPELMSSIIFPKKVIMGNFDNELISSRSTGFESLLKHISVESRLRSSRSLLDFLRDVEMNKAKEFINQGDYASAYPILENCFKLLNKVYTDRSPAVLLALCRVLACTVAIPKMPNSLKWANLALHRYEGVSDSDLLELYVPLLKTGIQVWDQNDMSKDDLEKRLASIPMQGLIVRHNETLSDAVDRVDQKIFASK